MDNASIIAIASILKATSPFGFIALLAWGFWKVSERKDKLVIEMHERLIDIAEKQTQAVVKMEAALNALRSAIEGLARR